MTEDNAMRKSEKRFLLAQRMTYTLLAIILFLYGLIAIRNFLYPIAFGFLLAYLLFPIANWLEKKRVPRILANFITIIGVLGIMISLILLAYSQVAPVAGELPKLIDTGIRNLSAMLAVVGEYFGFDRSETRQLIQEQTSAFIASGGEYLQDIFSSTASTIVAIGLLPVYIFLFLYYRTKFAYFLLKIAGPTRRKETIEILREISKVSARYMGGVIAVVTVLCFLNSLGLWIIGVRFAIALGIISAFFNFIPYFGTLLGGLVPFLFALLVENDPVLAFRVIILFIIIQFIENNILTPNIVGGNVKVNPFFIITGLVAASIIWGIPGMLLIVPFLAIMRIIFSRIDSMRPYAFLLGEEGTAKHSVTMSKLKKLWPWGKKQFRKTKDQLQK
ncbi:MAG: AI-2E family transporter [Bacteroidetes bacterium]|nr:MAG: AI-2E family transporter [Bacteroidota bacterium]